MNSQKLAELNAMMSEGMSLPDMEEYARVHGLFRIVGVSRAQIETACPPEPVKPKGRRER